LVRLSQLEGLDVNGYKEHVLPKILEEIVDCKDTIAQSYLMDCIIQVFPDDFHLATLEPFLNTCTALKEKVNVRTILESIMDRLASHVATAGGSTLQNIEVNAFKLFNDCITTLIEERSNMSLCETLKLQTSLTNFALKCYPSRVDYVSHCLNTCAALIEKTDFVSTSATESVGPDGRSSNETTVQIEALLSAPLSSLALRVLEIPGFTKVMSYLPWGNWKEVAASLLRSVIATNAKLSDVDMVEQLFGSITPLLRDKEGTAPPTDEDGRELPPTQQFKDEQNLVARVVHLMKSDDTDALLRVYGIAKKHFTNGGTQRIKYTLTPLVFGGLALSRRIFVREKAAASDPEVTAPQFSSRKAFHFVLELVTAMATSFPEQSLNLFLQAAQAADECTYNAIAYEFMKEALLLFECEVSESKAQVRCLTTVVGTLLNCVHFPSEDYVALITKVAQHANKLLKKPDQCRMVTLCAHLFWPRLRAADGPERFSDSDRVLECMQRALKIASVCDPNLFVEILDR
jgi:vacuolar protein sorting-associated protein 35